MSAHHKHDTVATDNKPARRGATGRAAVLRRAPSDSDCSGETASLSADSGERRPPPPPPPRGKTRSRRRGSEWEVLEGLKDGQRFERRPEVFNGFLHKKRKWPLKGWHKRFFVVDGGILVYARSPTDVARGRLHGSLDVGLSVISAKPRRRRIDIDADEFIYHLRAKTPDVFRTWLNVLKAHRLYRQHLLTFGARESVPKIHAPLDDLPPTDNSSRITQSSLESFSSLTQSPTPKNSIKLPSSEVASSVYNNEPPCTLEQWKANSYSKTSVKKPNNTCGSLCSTHCIEKKQNNHYDSCKKLPVIPLSDEQQMHSTDLEMTTLKSYTSDSTSELKLPNLNVKNKERDTSKLAKGKLDSNLDTLCRNENPAWLDNKDETTVFCFSRKHRNRSRNSEEWTMKRSRKCTNLVKYRNASEEPVLTKPLLRQMILCKYKLNVGTRSLEDSAVNCDLNRYYKVVADKFTQDVVTASECDNISEKLILNLFHSPDDSNLKCAQDANQFNLYAKKVVKELYDLEITAKEKYPVKFLFKSLLQYFLKNTEGKFKGSCQRNVYISKPSNTYFTRDVQISTVKSTNISKETQKSISSLDAQYSEKAIKSNIYFSTTGQCNSIETDIKITKTLIDNLDSSSIKCGNQNINDDLAESSELLLLQDYIKHLMSETCLPKDVAKDFLNAYLEVLEHSNKSIASADSSNNSREYTDEPLCDIQTECVQKRVSKGVSTDKMKIMSDNGSKSNATERPLNLKDILDNMIGLLTCKKDDTDIHDQSCVSDNKCVASKTDLSKARLKLPEIVTSNNTFDTLVSEIIDENTIVIDLSKYDIEDVLMSNGANVVGTTCLTINLKGNSDSNESKLRRLSLKFNNNSPIKADTSHRNETMSNKDNSLYQVSMESENPLISGNIKSPYNDVDFEEYSTSSEATSKANLDNDSYQSLDIPYNKNMRPERIPCPNYKDNTQCFFLSSIEEDVPIILDNKKKSKELDHLIPGTFSPKTCNHKNTSSGIVNKEFILRVFEKMIALTKDIPGINNEINNMYLKLKNMQDKSNKDISRVSLFGSINGTRTSKKSLQEEPHVNSSVLREIRRNIQKKAVEIAINTSFIYPKLRNSLDKALSAIFFAEVLASIGVQTLSIDVDTKEAKFYDNAEKVQANHKSGERQIEMDDKDEWFKSITREYVETAAVKSMLKKYHQLPQSIRIAHPILAKIPEKFVTPLNSSMVATEMSSLSPPLTTSNRSQKDKEKILNNFEVEQLFKRTKSKMTRAESMTDCSEYNSKSEISDELKTLYRCTSDSYCSGLISPNGAPLRGPQAGFVSGTPGGRLAGWIVESGGPLESASRELGQAQLSVQQLQRLLDAMLELQHQLHHDTDVSLEGASPNVKKDRRKFGLRKKKSNSKCASVELAPPHVDSSSSHMALSALTAPPSPGGGASSMPNSAASLPIACAAARPQSLPGAESLGVGAGGPASLTSLTPDHQLREDFTILAKDLVANLKSVVSTLVVERGRLRAAMEVAEAPAAGGVVAALRTNLTSALQQNSELRTRLSRIHDASDLAEISSVGNNSDQVTRPFPQSLSYSSSCVSASEFFDAEEHDDELKPAEIIATDEAGVIELDGDSSSEAGSLSSEEGSASSDNSDGATSAVIPASRTPLSNGSEPTCARRARLPCPRPTPASPSLWNLLYKNIGKDLSQISMPVTINEPLNMLQRLCEELEYSSLLDSASECTNELDRMALVAAFAVSAYAASAHRAASKPFNPLLAETYECIRTDRDFRFLAEQVSHHPPISACHAESPRWVFWQEARIKTKFWGKSMEFQPTGQVHVRLQPSGAHYSWNKVTTCVHNLFGGQRWVDQYGDMHIVCHGTDITCKLQFIKASSWSSSRHEVRGVVLAGGAPRMRLAGRWSEGLQGGERTLWRPGAMPPDYELYYGFTRFAMELNELEPGMRDVLPSTDTRLRPDQRALEEGNVEAAEQFKHELEQAQRERRRDGVEHNAQWFRKTMEEGEETWVFTGEYWKAREAGFTDTPRLW